jgi:predicted dehydrogenase
MSKRHQLALAGCGGMGRRHLRGYRVLEDFEPGRIEVAAVIDPESERAEFVAGEAEERFGTRPKVYKSLEDAIDGVPGLEVVDIVAAAAVHHSIAQVAAEAGIHVMCEKPMAPTVAACRAMADAAQQHGTVLSIAENYRRDPISRLASALLQAGAIGEIRTVLDLSSGGGKTASAGGWQYLRKHGGSILESGVHNADMQMYLAGPVRSITGQVRLHERERFFKGAGVKGFHEHYSHTYPDVQPADAPDMMMATLEFENSALGQWLDDRAARGPGFRRFTIYGSEGQIDLPGVRNGQPLRVFREDHDGVLNDEAVLSLVPDFALDDRTARFFGGKRLARYDNSGSGVGGGADLNILAMEVAELLDAIDNGTPVEVNPEVGLAAVALVMASHESSEAGRAVTMAEIVDGSLSGYQDVANRELGIGV